MTMTTIAALAPGTPVADGPQFFSLAGWIGSGLLVAVIIMVTIAARAVRGDYDAVISVTFTLGCGLALAGLFFGASSTVAMMGPLR